MQKISQAQIVEQAEIWLKENYTPIKIPTVYIAGFQTRDGRHVALARNLQNIKVWTESVGTKPIKDRSVSVKIYESSKPRNHNLKAQAPRLAEGRPAEYRTFITLGDFKEFIKSYSQ